MDFKDYQEAALKTAAYPGAGTADYLALAYVTMGLTGEAGEISNKLKKVLRGDKVDIIALREDIKAELGDVLWYIATLAHEFDLKLDDIAKYNVNKLMARKSAGKIKGSGDKR